MTAHPQPTIASPARSRRFRDSPEARQQREIVAVRTTWEIDEPKPRPVPRWFTTAVTRAIRSGSVEAGIPYGDAIVRLCNSRFANLFDHPGVVTIDGDRVVVGEPYETSVSTDRGRAMAAELAEILDCRCWVSLRSWHYPDETIRVQFAPSTSGVAR